MSHPTVKVAFFLLALPLLASICSSQQAVSAVRAPATPLVTHDPYFSIWSVDDHLTDGSTRHWTGARHELNGLVRIDGENYRYLGDADSDVPALNEIAREITPTRTIVTFQNARIELRLCFLTPAIPSDLPLMARPVTYLTWDVHSRDNAEHDVTLYLDADSAIATNTRDEAVVWSRAQIPGQQLLRVGSQQQPVLQKWGDNLRIDWGYFYLAVPEKQGVATLAAGNSDDRAQFLSSGTVVQRDDLDQPRVPQSRYPASPMLSVTLPLGKVGASAIGRRILLAYDDQFSIEYMHQRLLPYWRKGFPSFADMLQAADQQYEAVEKRCEAFDAELERDLLQEGGPAYASISVLAFRQAIAAHKLVEDADGVPFFMPKENFSNGSISTVDVIYPSAPMFLLLNPKLAEAQLEPLMRYVQTSRWKFPFAPHDLGVYPLANGQLYGGGERSEEDQMPVEETGNMILLFAAISHAEHNTQFAERYWPTLTKWAEYLLTKGFDPEKQLCTDDFAGHLAHNTNLSIKAIEALAAYAQMADATGDKKAAEKYNKAAKSMAAQWVQMAADGDHYKLAFDKSGTWSQKYNLIWDRVLGLRMFPADVAEKELNFYKAHLNSYGLPLDNRATYTKLDWTIWTATLTSNEADFQALVDPILKFLNTTPDRVPMSDWYDTVSAKQVGFQARSVVGGVYVKMLADPKIWEKWAGRSQMNR